MDMQKFTRQLADSNNPTTRRSIFGLLAGALAVTGLAGLQSADARRRGGRGRRGGRRHNRRHRY